MISVKLHCLWPTVCSCHKPATDSLSSAPLTRTAHTNEYCRCIWRSIVGCVSHDMRYRLIFCRLHDKQAVTGYQHRRNSFDWSWHVSFKKVPTTISEHISLQTTLLGWGQIDYVFVVLLFGSGAKKSNNVFDILPVSVRCSSFKKSAKPGARVDIYMLKNQSKRNKVWI